MSNFDTQIFGNKKFSDLLKDVYDNQKKKDRQIQLLISDLKPLITDVATATQLVPIIQSYLEVAVRNDEHLVKIAAVIQRSINNKSDDSGSFLTEEEKEALLKEIQTISNEQHDNALNESSKDDNKRTGI
jgi:hypothetical protein